jgi:hypothetical protein
VREVTALVNEEIEYKVMDARRCAAEVLEQIEVWPARLIESNDLAVDHRVVREIGEGLDYERELSVEGFAATRI